MIYLASPYSHPDQAVREARFHAVRREVVRMLKCGVHVFSPVVYAHALAEHGLPIGWKFWEPFDRAFLGQCDEVCVLMRDGWQTSEGVQAEIAIAREMGKRVVLLEPESMQVVKELTR